MKHAIRFTLHIHRTVMMGKNIILHQLQAMALPRYASEGLDWSRIQETAKELANEETLLCIYLMTKEKN